jgi:hypothetical protein
MRALPIVRLVFANSHAQPSGRAEFDVASIRPSAAAGGGPITVGCNGCPGTGDPSLFACQNMTFRILARASDSGLSAPPVDAAAHQRPTRPYADPFLGEAQRLFKTSSDCGSNRKEALSTFWLWTGLRRSPSRTSAQRDFPLQTRQHWPVERVQMALPRRPFPGGFHNLVQLGMHGPPPQFRLQP